VREIHFLLLRPISFQNLIDISGYVRIWDYMLINLQSKLLVKLLPVSIFAPPVKKVPSEVKVEFVWNLLRVISRFTQKYVPFRHLLVS